MEQVEVEGVIPAPVQSVWDRYTDHARWSEWAGLGPSRLLRAAEGDPNGVGAVRALGPGRFAAVEEVLEFEPPRRMVYALRRGPLPMKNHRGEVLFEDRGGETHVVWRCGFESRIPGVGWLLRLAVTRVFRGALAGLAREFRAGAASPDRAPPVA